MVNQDLIKHLKQLKNKDQIVKGTLVLESNSVLETTYHSGSWNDYEFECCFLAYWKSAEVDVEIDAEQLLYLLENKNLVEIDYSDFESVSLGEAINPNISLSAIEWVNDEPSGEEKEENDFEEIELYNDSDINDCECTFEAGNVLSMKFEIEGNSYTIDNTSDYLEENENNKKSIKIEIFSDGVSNKIGLKSKYQKEISEFLKEWDNTLCYFDGEFLVEDENEDVWILVSPSKPLIVFDDDLYNEDEYLSCKDKAVIACLNNIIEFSGDCKFDLGEVCFEDGFYSAIVKLTQLQNDTDGFILNAKVETSEGHASGIFKFNKLGKIASDFNSNEMVEFDDKFLEEAFAEHNAHEEGFDFSPFNDSDDNNACRNFIQCKFNYRPTYIYLSTCDSIEDAKAQNFKYLGESNANSSGTLEYNITEGDKVIFHYRIPVNHPEEEDLNLEELEGKILVREINVYNPQSINAYYDPQAEDYQPGSVYFGLAYDFTGITFNIEDEFEGNELEEYIPEEGEGEEQYFEYYQIVNGKPVKFDLDDDAE